MLVKDFQTPNEESQLWWADPAGEDRGDPRTALRYRSVEGEYYVLCEFYCFRVFPPEFLVAQKLKPVKDRLPPPKIEKCFVHLMNCETFATRTIKVYKHGSEFIEGLDGIKRKYKRWFYLDSYDWNINTASREAPPKDRHNIVKLIMRLLKINESDASEKLIQWTGV